MQSFWKPFWNPFWNQIRPGQTGMSPGKPLGPAKNQKTTFMKISFSRGSVSIFSLLRHRKTTSRGPGRLPRNTQRTLKPPKKNIQNWTQNLHNFRQYLKQFWTPKMILKIKQKRGNFLTPLPPHLKGPNNAPPKNMREG